MKKELKEALCVKRIFKYAGDRFLTIEKGETIKYYYDEETKSIVIKEYAIPMTDFFWHFDIPESDKEFIILDYGIFELIVTRTFSDAMLFPTNYSGVRTIIVQISKESIIMIAINEDTGKIRISFNDEQVYCDGYYEAIKALREKKGE